MHSAGESVRLTPTRDGLADAFRTHPHPGAIIVHPTRRFIYMKPTKTAGTSILRRVLEPQIGGFIHRKDHPDAFASWLADITDEALRGYYIFAVVRNPWDRIVSLSAFTKIPLSEMLDAFDDLPPNRMIPAHRVPLTAFTHLNGLPFVDRICRFERLDEDMRLIFDDLGLPAIDIPHVNKSRRFQKLRTQLNTEQIAWVAERYAADIAAYGYTAPTPLLARLRAAIGFAQNDKVSAP